MKRLFCQLTVCFMVFGSCLYSYLSVQNELTELKIKIPRMKTEIDLMLEENCRLVYEIDLFQNPAYLMELAHRPEFAHLKHPLFKEVLTVPELLVTNEVP